MRVDGLTPEPAALGANGAKMAAAVDDVRCIECGRADGEADFVLCDRCPDDDVRGGHWRCLGMARLPTAIGSAIGAWRTAEGRTTTRFTAMGDGDGDGGPTRRAAAHRPDCPSASVRPERETARARPRSAATGRGRRGAADVGVRLLHARVAVDAALSRAPGYAGDSVDARRKRDAFFSKLLMPAVHTMGSDGWDLALAVQKLAAGRSPREPYDDAAARNEAGADGVIHGE